MDQARTALIEDWIARCRASRDQEAELLGRLEKGNIRHRRPLGNGDWEDYTDEIIADVKRVIAVWDGVIRAYERDKAAVT